MPELNDREYFVLRAAKALQLHETAVDPAIAAIHRCMADRYHELAMPVEEQRPMLRVVSA